MFENISWTTHHSEYGINFLFCEESDLLTICILEALCAGQHTLLSLLLMAIGNMHITPRVLPRQFASNGISFYKTKLNHICKKRKCLPLGFISP